MAKVFISYSRKDIEFAKRLTAELQKSELDFWIDWEGIPPTVDWWKEIEKGIEEADVFLFLISPDSAKSKICGQEIDTAVKNGKRIIPIVVREIEWQDTPPQLGHLNYIFFSRDDDFDTAVKKLLTAIQTDYEWAATHRRLQVKALEWERENKENSYLLRGRDLQDAELDLATNTSKDPHPTDLQREYVFASRKATDRQRRITTSISIAGVIALAALAVIAFVQAGLATTSRNDAQAASTLAVANEQTAQAASTIAVSNEKKADEQAQIALARQLAVQAQLLNTDDDTQQIVASLLTIQSLKLHPTTDAVNFVLNNNFAAPPTVTLPSTDVKMLVFSPDGKYILSAGCTKSEKTCVRIWETETGNEVIPAIQDQKSISNILFSQDGKRLFVVGCDKEDENSTCKESSVRVYATETGSEIEHVQTNPNDIVHISSDQGKIISYTCDHSIVFPFSTEMCLPTNIHFLEIATDEVTADKYPKSDIFMNTGISPNGKYIFSLGKSNAFLWEVDTGNEIFTTNYPFFGGLFSTVISEAQNGKYVAAIAPLTGFNARIKVWDTKFQQETINADYSVFGSLPLIIFSPNADFIIAAGSNLRTRIWETATGNEVSKFIPSINSISFDTKGKYFISNTKNVAVVRETATGNEIARMTHNSAVTAVALSPNGQSAASADDEMIHIWKVGTAITHPTSNGIVYFSSNREYALTAGCDELNVDNTCTKNIGQVWQTISGRQVNSFVFNGDVKALSPDGKYVVTSSCEDSDNQGNCIRLRLIEKETATEKEILNKLLDSLYVSDIFFSSDGKYFMGSTEKNTYVWETAAGREAMKIPDVGGTSISPDGNFLILVGTKEFSMWEIKIGKRIATAPIIFETYSKIAFSPNSQYVTIQDQNSARTWVWETTTGKEIVPLRNTTDQVLAVFSPNTRYLALLGANNILYVWDVSTGKEIRQKMIPEASFIRDITFSPNENLLGYISIPESDMSSTIKFWDFINDKDFPDISIGTFVDSFSFSLDSKYVVSNSGEARIWDIATGTEIVRLSNGISVSSTSFVMDGRYLISSDYNNNIVVWPWQPKDVIEHMCKYLPRNLSYTEWNQYIGNAWPYPTKQKDATCSNLSIEPKVVPTPIVTP